MRRAAVNGFQLRVLATVRTSALELVVTIRSAHHAASRKRAEGRSRCPARQVHRASGRSTPLADIDRHVPPGDVRDCATEGQRPTYKFLQGASGLLNARRRTQVNSAAPILLAACAASSA